MIWTLIWLVIGGAVILGIVAVINTFLSNRNGDSKGDLKRFQKIYAVQDKALSEIAGGIAGNPVYTAQAALDESRRIKYSTDS